MSDVMTCARCKAEVTVFQYRDEDGWLCERCAPDRVIYKFESRGCSYIDTYKKYIIHSMLFCQLVDYCFICNDDVPQGSLYAHYGSVHQDITHRAGSTWQATWTGFPEESIRLISSVAGITICEYWLSDKGFSLAVCIPVSSEGLREFRCVVRLVDPTTGHTSTYTPDIVYNTWWDWYIEVQKEEFPSWNSKFNVSVDIDKID